MATSHIVLMANILIAVAFASAFFAIHVYDRRQEAALNFGLAYACGAVEASCYIAQALTGVREFRLAGSLALVFLLAFFVKGVARLYRRPAPIGLVTGLLAALAMLGVWSTLFDPTFYVRFVLFPLPIAAIMAISAWLVWRAPAKARLDRILLALLAANTVQFLLRPVGYLAFVDGVLSPQAVASSGFLIAVHTGISIGAVATALILLSAICLGIKREIDERAVRDTLSGLLNRRGFEERAGAMLAAAKSDGPRLALILTDIDRFKSINDRYGHAFGDEVIAAMGALLTAHAREGDCVGRIGGEEFAVLLQDADGERALAIAERMRERFAARLFAIGEDSAGFTASFGVTAIVAGDALNEALRRADIALYEAKNTGRDRIAASAAAPRLAA